MKGKNVRLNEKIKMLELAKRPLTSEEIGKAVGRHASTVYEVFRANGVHSAHAHRQHDIIDARIAKLEEKSVGKARLVKRQIPSPSDALELEPHPSPSMIGLTAGLRALESLSSLIDKGIVDDLVELVAVLEQLKKTR